MNTALAGKIGYMNNNEKKHTNTWRNQNSYVSKFWVRLTDEEPVNAHSIVLMNTALAQKVGSVNKNEKETNTWCNQNSYICEFWVRLTDERVSKGIKYRVDEYSSCRTDRLSEHA